MRKWKRPKQPAELSTNKAVLTREFKEEASRTAKTPKCKWPEVALRGGGKETLQKMMSRSTARHCSYCDCLLGRPSPKTIDHFLPKSRKAFHDLAYAWKNLYLACHGCQIKKGKRFDDTAFRPDEPGYEFALYFRYTREGKIEIIPPPGPLHDRAEATIELFKLRDEELENDRRLEFILDLKPRKRPRRARQFLGEEIYLDDRPFRDWYGSGL